MTRRSCGVRVLADNADIEKPDNDRSSYRVILLPNNLEAALISDPGADLAAVCLTTRVGSFQDDRDIPGIAHAVEHMLEKGSAKYPGENDFSTHVQKHGGNSNAATSSYSTAHFFEISAVASPDQSSYKDSPLYKALDIFAHSFKQPLFPQDALRREMTAVDHEFKANLLDTEWRAIQLDRALASPKSLGYKRFTIGNLQTLYEDPIASGIRLCDRFRGWYDSHFSADRMKLVVTSRESLDQLQTWITGLFSDIPDKRLGSIKYDQPVYRPNREMGSLVYAQLPRQTPVLQITFARTDNLNNWQAMVEEYMVSLLGATGSGTLEKALSDQNLASNVSTTFVDLDVAEPIIWLKITLTPQGLRSYRDVAALVFQYLGMLVGHGPQRWYHEQQKMLAKLAFRFEPLGSGMYRAMNLGDTLLSSWDRRRLLSVWVVPTKYDPEAISALLDEMTPLRARLTLWAPGHPDVRLDETEVIHGTKYAYQRIPDTMMKRLQRIYARAIKGDHPHMAFPRKNVCIPRDFHVDEPPTALTRLPHHSPEVAPQLIRNEIGMRTWWKKDHIYLAPQAFYALGIRSAIMESTLWIDTVMQLWVCLVHIVTAEYRGMANTAGLYMGLAYTGSALRLEVSGWNDTISMLLEHMLQTMSKLDFTAAQLASGKQDLVSRLSHGENSNALPQTVRWRKHIFAQQRAIEEDSLNVLECLTKEDLDTVSRQLFKIVHLEILAYGNVSRRDALRTSSLIEAKLGRPLPLAVKAWPQARTSELTNGTEYLFRTTCKSQSSTLNAIAYNVYTGEYWDERCCASGALFADIVGDYLYHELRGQQELGYVVQSEQIQAEAQWAISIRIESTKHPELLQERIEDFLIDFEATLRDMDQVDFEEYKAGAINRLLIEPDNMDLEFGALLEAVEAETYDFCSPIITANAVTRLTKSSLLKYYTRYIRPGRASTSPRTVIQVLAYNQSDESQDYGNRPSKYHNTMTSRLAQGTAHDAPSRGMPQRIVIDNIKAFWASTKLAKPLAPITFVDDFEVESRPADTRTALTYRPRQTSLTRDTISDSAVDHSSPKSSIAPDEASHQRCSRNPPSANHASNRASDGLHDIEVVIARGDPNKRGRLSVRDQLHHESVRIRTRTSDKVEIIRSRNFREGDARRDSVNASRPLVLSNGSRGRRDRTAAGEAEDMIGPSTRREKSRFEDKYRRQD